MSLGRRFSVHFARLAWCVCTMAWAALCAVAQEGSGTTLALPPADGQIVRIPAPEDLPPPDASLTQSEVPVAPADPVEPGKSEFSKEANALLRGPGESWEFWTPKFWDPWEGNVELGMNGTDGNTETFNIRFGMTAKHKTELRNETLQITSIQKRANGATTANTALVDGRIEWPMPNSKWNYFMHSLLEYDQFKAFDARVSADTGFGYEFIQNDLTTLIGRSGLAMSHEIGGPNNKVNPELYFGGEFKRKFSDTHSFLAKVDYYPNVTAFGDFRLNSQASWEMALVKSWGVSLKFSLIDRYDSTPSGAKPNDLDYSTLLLWNF
ncbi:MAG: DUF481 domain-containing protein [Planctomycetaceae bacterium]